MRRWRVVLTAAVLAMSCSFPVMATGGPGMVGKWKKAEDGRTRDTIKMPTFAVLKH